MNDINLILVFEDTLEKCKEIKIKGETSKFTFKNIIKESGDKGNIIVENLDTVSAGVKYSKLGKTCLLNMASYKRPGGGVERGASAQEECLFRCSNLWNLIDKSFYPLRPDESLYTKNAVFIKDRRYDYMDPIIVDVITIAAINLNEVQHFFGNRVATYKELVKILDYENITKDKIRLMLSLCIQNCIENVVLGAWGCGVFKNDPEKMASFFKEVLEEGYGSKFKNVSFSIINDHNSVGNNYQIFSNILK